MNGPPRWAKLQQSPTNSKARKKKKNDQSVVVLLIYQSFDMSPVRVELAPRITRFIFPQLKNGLGLEFSALCGHTSLEISTDTRLPKQNSPNRSVNGLLPYLLMSPYESALFS
jgi:hypothetical protein